jgi:hypothetical protein
MTQLPPQENAWPIQAFVWLEWVGCGRRSSPRVIRRACDFFVGMTIFLGTRVPLLKNELVGLTKSILSRFCITRRSRL